MTPKLSGSISQGSRENRLEGTAWGLLFIWIGLALMAHLGWGVGLLGVGAIILGAQAWRSRSGLSVEGFSVLLGGVFVLGGASNLLRLNVDLVPFIFILCGIVLLASAKRAQRH